MNKMFGHRWCSVIGQATLVHHMGCLPKWNHCSKGCSVFLFCFFCENLVCPWRFHEGKKSDPVFKFGKALVLGLHCNWARSHLPPGTGPYSGQSPWPGTFPLHKGAAGPSSCGKTRVWRETRTKRGAVRRGNTNGRNFLGRSVLAELLGPSVLAELLRWPVLAELLRLSVLSETRGATESCWVQRVNTNGRKLLRLSVLAELPRLSVLSERLVATEQKTFFVRAFAQAGVAEATLACICVPRMWAAGCGRFANVRSGRGECG
jgi:hypothetical protein